MEESIHTENPFDEAEKYLGFKIQLNLKKKFLSQWV